jgi:ABC-2 type transport system permease protein
MALLMGTATRAQYGAIARMRWRTLVNSLRKRSGKFELGASLLQSGFFLLLWLGASIGLGVSAWQFATNDELKRLSLLLWPVLIAWQLIPILLSSFQENVDLTILLRFPVSFQSYVLLYLFFGFFDLLSLVGSVALLGIWIGIVAARPNLMLPAAVGLALFAAFNLLLARTIFAWIDRWLAQRKTREILGMLVLFFFLGLQFLNPAFHQRRGHISQTQRRTVLNAEIAMERVERPLPPALTARSIEMAAQDRAWRTLTPLGGIALYTLGIAALLGFRLRAEYRGEKLSDSPGYVEQPQTLRVRKRQPGFQGSGAIGAVVEKELRYLSRSGAMLYSLAAPLVLVFLFGGTSRAGRASSVEYALPLGVAYGFLGLTRLLGNSLGGEAAGIQLYFLSPTPFRTIMLGKNLLQTGLFCVELVLVCAIVWFRFGMPEPQIIEATFCWLLFALPVQLALGNVLSIKMAYRMTLTRLSREQGAMGNALVSLLIQLVVFAIGAAVLLPLTRVGHANWAAPIFLALAVCGFLLWLLVLSKVDSMAGRQREVLLAALVRIT